MKRFLSLFLSVLILFQIENISCDARSQFNRKPNYDANYNMSEPNYNGSAYQGQTFDVIKQPSQPQPPQGSTNCKTGDVIYSGQPMIVIKETSESKKSVLGTICSGLGTAFSLLVPVVSLGLGMLWLLLKAFPNLFGLLSKLLKKGESKNNEKENEKNSNCSMCDCCGDLKEQLGMINNKLGAKVGDSTSGLLSTLTYLFTFGWLTNRFSSSSTL